MKTEVTREVALGKWVLVAAICVSSCLCAEAAASPTGIIAFSRHEGDNRDIYTMKPDGTDVARLTQTDDLWEWYPRWSPDGTKIAFARSAGRGQNPDIWVMNSDGTGQVNLTNTPDVWEEWHFWSPDGQKIGYPVPERFGEIGIRFMNADGTGHTTLTQGHGDGHADWSPDGTRIIFDRAMTPTEPIGHGELHVMNADGTNVQRLTYTGVDDWVPAWSPDGTKVAFLSLRDGNYLRDQIYVGDFVVDADGNAQLLNQTNMTANEWRHGHPRWSPDGTQIVFDRSPYATWQGDLWIMNADGSGQVQLTNTPYVVEAGPDWGMPVYGVTIPAPGAILLSAVGVALFGYLRRRRTL